METTYESTWHRAVFFHLPFITSTILGQYARAGTTALADYKPSYVASGSVIWSNFAACMLMGLMQELHAAEWFTDPTVKPFFTAITTGFCGCYSSFSTLMLETFEHSASLTPSDIQHGTKLPNRAYGIMEFLSVVLTQLLGSMGAYLFGRGIAKSIVVPLTSFETVEKREDTPSPARVPKPWVRTFVWTTQILLNVLAIPLIALIIVLTCVYGNYSRGSWTLPALFAIFGKYLRYYLSVSFNGLIKDFPVGTFIANQSAVIFVSVFELVLRGRKNYHEILPVTHTVNSCHVISALLSGFCGALSTTSTFINEGYNLEFNHMLIYFASTIATAYCLLVIILGSYAWTRGLTLPLC